MVRQLIVRFATENPGWGYTRIRGALRYLGHDVGRSTIKRVLHDHDMEPAPVRGKRIAWTTFLKAHLGVLGAMDFFSVEVLTLAGLVRYSVLFVIDVATRHVHIAGIDRAPDGRWMLQVARNLTDAIDGVLRGTRYLIRDRDPLFTREFDGLLRAAGVECLKLPARSPDLNAYAERFVLSIKSECLWKIIPLGEGHLRRAVAEFVAHYHLERNHQGLENQLIVAPAEPANGNGPVARRERLGGMLSFYYRRAA